MLSIKSCGISIASPEIVKFKPVNVNPISSNRTNTSVRLLDTTLRDGEQMPGIALNPESKLRIALALEELGVDSIEAGFPVVSEGEFEAVKIIAKNVSRSEVIALSRTVRSDIDKVIDADANAIHIFIATSDMHMKYKLRMGPEEVIRAAVESVEYAKSHGLTVEFSAEDSTRSRPEFLVRVFQEVINAGADRVDIADTVGVMWPSAMYNLVRYVRENLRGNYLLSVHCHNDFGMAVANSIAAVEAGANQVHVTVLGVGERAGNASLEEVATALKFLLGLNVNIRFELIYSTAILVAESFGITIPHNKPIVGVNAFSHESGIHVHGVLSNPLTYEPISPEVVGTKRRIVLGKHSGKHAVVYILKQLGIEPDDRLVNEVLKRIKELGDRGVRVSYEDVVRLIRVVTDGNSVESITSK